MDSLTTLQDPSQLKLLGDPTRLRILELLMGEPASLSELGRALDVSPAHVRHHLKKLEAAGFVRLESKHEVRGFVEKRYAAAARAYQVNFFILPDGREKANIVITGSDDSALRSLGRLLEDLPGGIGLTLVPVGSLNGLIAVRQGLGHAAGCHLFDPLTGEYNLPQVRALFPDREVRVIRFVSRTQGLLAAPGNPMNIRSVPDAVEKQARFVLRNRGSGTRLLLDQEMQKAGVSSGVVVSPLRDAVTHAEVAESIAAGLADVGLGLLSAARRLGLAFVPLQEERFDLVFPAENEPGVDLAPLLETLNSAAFRRAAEKLGGYDLAESGSEVRLNA